MQMQVPVTSPTRSRSAAVAIARAILPSTAAMEGGSQRTVEHTERFLARLIPELLPLWRAAHLGLSEAARAFTGGRALTELSEREAEELIAKWATLPALRTAVNGIASVYKITHFDIPDTRGALRHVLPKIDNVEQPRWLEQMQRAADWDETETIECDVVVMGTGAGGAVVGRHLGEQGHAVVFVEEGEHIRRHQFPRNFASTLTDVYRNLLAVGNNLMIVPRGKLVGGSTAVNTGTSFRPPRWITDRWAEELRSDEFSMENLTPYFERVESILGVEKADERFVGPVHAKFTSGARKLGWHSATAVRNAPGCRGEGMCDNGCPTDARRSTNLSYLPPALERGAFVLSGFRADRVILEGGRAVGLSGIALTPKGTPQLTRSGDEKRITIRARAVILAGGAMATPAFLLRQGLANSSDQVGRNLTLHPSGPTVGLFDDVIDGDKFIPQGVYSHEFLREGIMLVGAAAESHMMPPLLPFVGQRLMHVVEQHRHLAGLGFLIADDSRGRIRLGPGGRSVMTYKLVQSDVKRLHRAQVLTTELLLASGAREVYPGMLFPITIRDRAGLHAFSSKNVGASDFLLTSYHPLGTCKMSPDPKRGVIDTNHQCHDVPGLFIVDGSSVQGPLGVNPQISIMALATRAADKIGALLD